MKRRLLKTLAAVLAIAAAAAGPVRGQNASPDVTLDFTTNDWGIPSGKANKAYDANSYTSGDYTITLQGGGGSSNGYYFNSGYLMLGKSGAYLELPEFSSPVEKIEVVGNSAASPQVTQNIYVGETAVSTQTTGGTGTNTYVINENYQAAGNIYTLKVDNSYNTQITYIKVYYVSSGGGSGSEPPTPGQNSNVSWVLTPYGDLQTGDTVVIVDKTSERALPNNGGTSSTSSAVEIGLSGDQNALTAAPAATLKWVVVLNNGNYQFRKPGTDDQFLYCINTFAGVRVGDNDANQFTFENGGPGIGGPSDVPFLKNTGISRYLGVYNNQEWRCYLSISSDIENTVIGFYVRTGAAPAVPHTVRFASGNDGWTVTDVDSARSATAPAVLQNVMAGDSLVVTAPATLPGKVKSVKAVKYVAPPDTAVAYSFDNASSPSMPSASRVGFDYAKTSVITNTAFLNAFNNQNGDPSATSVSLGTTNLSDKSWTLSFEWAACGGCNSKPDHTTLKSGSTTLFDFSGNSNWNETVTIIYSGSDGTKTLPVSACDKDKRFTDATGNQLNTTAYWHHVVITGGADGVKMTITNSSTGTTVVQDVVLSATNVNPTELLIEPCCGGAIGIDELLLIYTE